MIEKYQLTSDEVDFNEELAEWNSRSTVTIASLFNEKCYSGPMARDPQRYQSYKTTGWTWRNDDSFKRWYLNSERSTVEEVFDYLKYNVWTEEDLTEVLFEINEWK